MEKHFLQYLLYITFVEFREQAYEAGDKRQFWLADMLHSIPLALSSEDDIREAYQGLIDNVKNLGVENWLDVRKEEFYSRYPQFKNNS